MIQSITNVLIPLESGKFLNTKAPVQESTDFSLNPFGVREVSKHGYTP